MPKCEFLSPAASASSVYPVPSAKRLDNMSKGLHTAVGRGAAEAQSPSYYAAYFPHCLVLRLPKHLPGHRQLREEAFQLDPNEQDRIDEHQAGILLGVPAEELRWFSRVSHLGRTVNSDRGEEVVFTCEELRSICMLAASSDD